MSWQGDRRGGTQLPQDSRAQSQHCWESWLLISPAESLSGNFLSTERVLKMLWFPCLVQDRLRGHLNSRHPSMGLCHTHTFDPSSA